MRIPGRVKRLTIAKPCGESWDSMNGETSARYCEACNRSVYDLSVLTRRQAAELLDSNGGKICGRITYDDSGHQVFAKEPDRFQRLVRISILGASAMTCGSAAPTQGCEVQVRVNDSTGAIVPRAAVTIAKAEGGETVSSGTSNDEGVFSASTASGHYLLSVAQAGFATFRKELTCTTSERLLIDANLQVALMGEVVQVKRKPFFVIRMFRALFASSKRQGC